MLKLEKEGLISRSEYSKIISDFENANLMETYYKARKNLSNSLAQQSFVNMGKLSTIRKSNNRRKAIMDTFRQFNDKNDNNNHMFGMLMNDKNKKSRKKTKHDPNLIIEEHEKESESDNKSIMPSNSSLTANGNSNQETEKNDSLSKNTTDKTIKFKCKCC